MSSQKQVRPGLDDADFEEHNAQLAEIADDVAQSVGAYLAEVDQIEAEEELRDQQIEQMWAEAEEFLAEQERLRQEEENQAWADWRSQGRDEEYPFDDEDEDDDEPQQVWFTEAPGGHYGFE